MNCLKYKKIPLATMHNFSGVYLDEVSLIKFEGSGFIKEIKFSNIFRPSKHILKFKKDEKVTYYELRGSESFEDIILKNEDFKYFFEATLLQRPDVTREESRNKSFNAIFGNDSALLITYI